MKYIFACVFIFLFGCTVKQDGQWQQLLDKNLSQWEPFLGVPHKSSGFEGYEDVEDVRFGTPLGMGNRNNVFSMTEENGEDVLKITGEIFGSLMSKEEFENYHLKFQVKWGDKRWEPRLKEVRNNGMLYHSIGEPGKGLWNTWMTSLEFEVENTNFGDFITINDDPVKAMCPSELREDGLYYFNPDSALKELTWANDREGRCYKTKDLEKPMGEWTTLELICYKDMALHLVEGEVVMAVYQPKFYNGTEWVPMNKGKLQIQSEAAETYFKNIEIRSIDTLDEQFQKYIR